MSADLPRWPAPPACPNVKNHAKASALLRDAGTVVLEEGLVRCRCGVQLVVRCAAGCGAAVPAERLRKQRVTCGVACGRRFHEANLALNESYRAQEARERLERRRRGWRDGARIARAFDYVAGLGGGDDRGDDES